MYTNAAMPVPASHNLNRDDIHTQQLQIENNTACQCACMPHCTVCVLDSGWLVIHKY